MHTFANANTADPNRSLPCCCVFSTEEEENGAKTNITRVLRFSCHEGLSSRRRSWLISLPLFECHGTGKLHDPGLGPVTVVAGGAGVRQKAAVPAMLGDHDGHVAVCGHARMPERFGGDER